MLTEQVKIKNLLNEQKKLDDQSYFETFKRQLEFERQEVNF